MKKTSTGLITFVVVLLAIGGLIQLIFSFVYFGQAADLTAQANKSADAVKEALLQSASTISMSATICLISALITFLTAGAFFQIRNNFIALDESQEKHEQKLEAVHVEVRPEKNGEFEFKKGTEQLHLGYYKQAFELFTESANKGYSKAMYNLGYCYVNGKGVDKNEALAREWFEKAAENGVAKAKEALEKMNQ